MVEFVPSLLLRKTLQISKLKLLELDSLSPKTNDVSDLSRGLSSTVALETPGTCLYYNKRPLLLPRMQQSRKQVALPLLALPTVTIRMFLAVIGSTKQSISRSTCRSALHYSIMGHTATFSLSCYWRSYSQKMPGRDYWGSGPLLILRMLVYFQ